MGLIRQKNELKCLNTLGRKTNNGILFLQETHSSHDSHQLA